jgi:predicted transcriptional regulator
MRDPMLDEIFARRGAVTAIAKRLGISTAAVSQWDRIPKRRLAEVSQVLGIDERILRPDLFERKQEAA